jgi:hypothetical protein
LRLRLRAIQHIGLTFCLLCLVPLGYFLATDHLQNRPPNDTNIYGIGAKPDLGFGVVHAEQLKHYSFGGQHPTLTLKRWKGATWWGNLVVPFGIEKTKAEPISFVIWFPTSGSKVLNVTLGSQAESVRTYDGKTNTFLFITINHHALTQPPAPKSDLAPDIFLLQFSFTLRRPPERLGYGRTHFQLVIGRDLDEPMLSSDASPLIEAIPTVTGEDARLGLAGPQPAVVIEAEPAGDAILDRHPDPVASTPSSSTWLVPPLSLQPTTLDFTIEDSKVRQRMEWALNAFFADLGAIIGLVATYTSRRRRTRNT